MSKFLFLTKEFLLCQNRTKKKKLWHVLHLGLFFSPQINHWFKSSDQTLKRESQFLSSILFLVTIMALLICSNETNITIFHDPSLRNEGTNLQKREGKEKKTIIISIYLIKQAQEFSKPNCVSWGSERRSSPFVERRGPLFGQHGPGTVDSALVLAWRWVHVPGFDYVYWGSDHRGNEAGAKCRNKVTR